MDNYTTPVINVANYILQEHGPMTAMKLQKLCYYAQAWSLVWEEAPLFPQKIYAWARGPVVKELYNAHRGEFFLENDFFKRNNPEPLSEEAQKTVNRVIEFYSKMSPQELSDLTHLENPWREARQGLAEGERGEAEITTASMHEYYDGL